MAVNTRRLVRMCAEVVANTIEHGECFYNADLMGDLLTDIEGLKSACLAYRAEIVAEEDE